MQYQKALRALELAEDYIGRAYTKLPGNVTPEAEKAVKSSLRSVRKAADKVRAEYEIERSAVEG